MRYYYLDIKGYVVKKRKPLFISRDPYVTHLCELHLIAERLHVRASEFNRMRVY